MSRITKEQMMAVLIAASGEGIATSFTDDFNRADGAAGNGWSGGDIVGNKLVITPTESAELLTNGDFSAWTADNPDGWSVGGESGSDPAVSEVGSGENHTGVGTGSANYYSTSSALQTDQITLFGSWHIARFNISFISGSFITASGWPTVSISDASQSIVSRYQFGALFRAPRITSAADITLDSISLKSVSDHSVFRDQLISNAYAQATITRNQLTECGIIQRSDSANLVLASIVRSSTVTQVLLSKLVAGVYTAVSAVNITYSAGATLRLTRNGTSYSVSYNGSTVISGATISDAVFDNATKWGLFSTYDGNSFDSYEWGAL